MLNYVNLQKKIGFLVSLGGKDSNKKVFSRVFCMKSTILG